MGSSSCLCQSLRNLIESSIGYGADLRLLGIKIRKLKKNDSDCGYFITNNDLKMKYILVSAPAYFHVKSVIVQVLQC